MNVQNKICIIARAVIIKNDKLLVCVGKNKEYFFLPGGHVEHSESIAHALVRELKEELGFESSIKRFLGVFESSFEPVYKNIKKTCHTHEINFIFEVDISNLEPHLIPQSPEDHTFFEWIDLKKELINKSFLLPKDLLPFIKIWLALDCKDAFKGDIK